MPSDPMRLPPHSVEAEQAVLGGLMLEAQAWDAVGDIVTADDFYRNDHRLIFEAAAAIVVGGQPVDVVTLSGYLERNGRLEDAGGLAYLGTLARDTPSAANIRAYAEIVRERSLLRRLISVGSDITGAAFNTEGRTARDLVDDAERRVFEIAEAGARGRGGAVRVGTILSSVVDRIDHLYRNPNDIRGVPTGFTELDKMTGGFQRGDLIIVAGRPSMGKTTLAVNIAENATLGHGIPSAVFSMEMSAEQVTLRMISSLGRINQGNLRTGRLTEEDWPRIDSAMTQLSQAKFFIDETPGLTPTDLRARARRLKREHNLGLIVVDYLQLMSVPGTKENRATEISEISRSMKALARELDVPVIALSQLNRGVEQRVEKRPVMSDLRECVTGETPVCLTDGRRIPIRDLVGAEPEVWSVDESRHIVPARSDKVWCVGRRPVFRVQLASGRSIRATAEHRLHGSGGWTTVAEIGPGARLAVAGETPRSSKRVANSDVWYIPTPSALLWDRVVAVTPDGEEEVFDLTVPGPSNWLADGIVTHNSGALEQDADVIVLIYREEVYEPNTPRKGIADIIIAKQRNGPIGDFQMTFLGAFTKFENYAPDTYGEGALR